MSTKIGDTEKKITWLCDSGAEVCVMGLNQLKHFKGAEQHKTDVNLFGAGNHKLGELYKVKATLKLGNNECKMAIYIIEELHTPLLNCKAMIKLGLMNEGWPNVVEDVLPHYSLLARNKEKSGGGVEVKNDEQQATVNCIRMKQTKDKEEKVQGCRQKEIRDTDKRVLILKKKATEPYDRGARKLSELKVGDIVRVQHRITKKWDLIAKVVEIDERKRSYRIQSETGRLYWRNKCYLRPYFFKETKVTEQDDNQSARIPDQAKQPSRRSTRNRRPCQRYVLKQAQAWPGGHEE